MITPQTNSKLYVCGDSFCSIDSEYGPNWVDILEQKLVGVDVFNLSSPGASNYQIYLQVRHALENNCQYLIYHATSSIRHEFKMQSQSTDRDSVDRYWNRSYPEQSRPMICTSWMTPENSLILNKQQSEQIKKFFTSFIDLQTEIEKNYLFIKATLDLIQENHVPNWIWSQGGFEHKKFSQNTTWDFKKYAENQSIYNLWDHYEAAQLRPFFHVTDPEVIAKICNYYVQMLQLTV